MPYQRFGSKPLTANTILEPLFSGLRWIGDKKRDDDLIRLLSVPSLHVSPATLNALISYSRSNPGELWHSIITSECSPIEDDSDITKFNEILPELRNILVYSHRLTVGQTLDHLIDFMNAAVPDTNNRWDPHVETLRRVRDDAQRWNDGLSLFLDRWELLEEADLYDSRADRVSLMSVHSAKGLEFQIVFVIGCEEDVFPHAPENKQADIEEERRLFFVAMTRAKDLLYLTRSTSRTIHGKKKILEPSRFLSEIPPSMTKDYRLQQKHQEILKAKQLTIF